VDAVPFCRLTPLAKVRPRERGILVAAGLYTATWGTAMALRPERMLRALGMQTIERDSVPWRAIGMIVASMAPGYLVASRRPDGGEALLVAAITGRILGIIGFLWARHRGLVPWRFGLTVAANDLVWLPGLCAVLRNVRRRVQAIEGQRRSARASAYEDSAQATTPRAAHASAVTTNGGSGRSARHRSRSWA
jgi:hypothetical protein